MKKKLIAVTAAVGMLIGLAGCASGGGDGGAAAGSGEPKAVEELVVGFAQVGAESGWRTANTKDIQAAFEDAGIELKFSDAQQKQENQIKAIRSYIQQGVDYIAFSPVVETGWDAVLNEAKAAGIPVVLTDRAVDSQDESLYVSFLGSDFIAEGEKAGQWVVDEYADATEPVNIVQLEGTTGAAPALDRAEGFGRVEDAGRRPRRCDVDLQAAAGPVAGVERGFQRRRLVWRAGVDEDHAMAVAM